MGMSEIKINRNKEMWVKVTCPDGGFMNSQSVEANLLFEILQKLEEIRCGLIDLEDSK